MGPEGLVSGLELQPCLGVTGKGEVWTGWERQEGSGYIGINGTSWDHLGKDQEEEGAKLTDRWVLGGIQRSIDVFSCGMLVPYGFISTWFLDTSRSVHSFPCVSVHSGYCNKIPWTAWFINNRFIDHSSGGWEVPDHGTGRFNVCQGHLL